MKPKNLTLGELERAWNGQLPKLDVAGSNPVFRSMFSIGYRDSDFLPQPSNGVQRSSQSYKLLILNSPS
jgi:hypothetical protein